MGDGKYPAAVINGDVEYGSVLAGQSSGLVKKVQPAAEIVSEVVHQAEQVLKRWGDISCCD